MLILNKASGQVTCGLPGLAALAQAELDRCLEARTGADVTRVVQKLFERRADLFPIREQGGAYFGVPDFLDSTHPVENAADAEAYLDRLARFSVALDDQSDAQRVDAARGYAAPAWSLRPRRCSLARFCTLVTASRFSGLKLSKPTKAA